MESSRKTTLIVLIVVIILALAGLLIWAWQSGRLASKAAGTAISVPEYPGGTMKMEFDQYYANRPAVWFNWTKLGGVRIAIATTADFKSYQWVPINFLIAPSSAFAGYRYLFSAKKETWTASGYNVQKFDIVPSSTYYFRTLNSSGIPLESGVYRPGTTTTVPCLQQCYTDCQKKCATTTTSTPTSATITVTIPKPTTITTPKTTTSKPNPIW